MLNLKVTHHAVAEGLVPLLIREIVMRPILRTNKDLA